MSATHTILAALRSAPERSFVELPSELLDAPAQPGAKQSTALGEAIAIASSEGMAFGPLHGATIKKFSRKGKSPRPTSKRDLDAHLAPYGVEIQHARGSGYFYFTDLTTGEQVGESIMVCHYADFDINRWTEEAASARLAATPKA